MIIDEYLDIVDEEDNVLGKASRDEIYEKLLPHRIVHILVFDNKGRILLQKRASRHKIMPLYWGTSVGGHVLAGESFEQAAKRELEEELGVMGEMELLGKKLYVGQHMLNFKELKKIVCTFKMINEGPFRTDEDEAELIEFLTLDEVRRKIKNGEKFMPELLFVLENHFKVS